MGEAGRTLDCLARAVQEARRLVRPALLDPPPDHFQAAADRLEHIVEIMRDPSGKLPDRLHLLALPQRFFGGQ